MNDVRAQVSRALFDSTPGTFRIIITTSTSEHKYDYDQLPRKQVNKNNKKKKHDQVKHLGLRICDWTKRLKPHQHVYT